GLLGAHVPQRAYRATSLGEIIQGCIRARTLNRFRDAEINNAWYWLAINLSNQDVRGLEIAMHDRFLMSVLHAFADLNHQLDAFAWTEVFAVAIRGDRCTADVFHHKVWISFRRRTRVENFRDGRVVHERKRLALEVETF